jgi:H+/Cl- antiporter ClcA
MDIPKQYFSKKNRFLVIAYSLFSLGIGTLVGSTSAFFLVTLEWATNTRENTPELIYFLPIAGFGIGWMYHYYGKEIVKGNNLLLEEFEKPRQKIQFKMAPFVYVGTILTHLFGGSAGREGTAVQMGVAVSDQFSAFFKTIQLNRKAFIVMGVSAGFASVFGTPIAGAIFALEVFRTKKIQFYVLVLSFITAFVADFTCHAWNIEHTQYAIQSIPTFEIQNLSWTVLVGIIFGVAALLFSYSSHFWSSMFAKYISYPPFRPVVGGIILTLVILGLGTTKYIGLGVPTIVDSFENQQNSYDFLLKIIFTTFTLGAGFKGGEVTPLFFVGATLGNALVWFIPLPMELLAGMGFVAVFAGATNTPIACSIMGMELFGYEAGIYLSLACFIAYIFSGKTGIYSAQRNERKYWFLKKMN